MMNYLYTLILAQHQLMDTTHMVIIKIHQMLMELLFIQTITTVGHYIVITLMMETVLDGMSVKIILIYLLLELTLTVLQRVKPGGVVHIIT